MSGFFLKSGIFIVIIVFIQQDSLSGYSQTENGLTSGNENIPNDIMTITDTGYINSLVKRAIQLQRRIPDSAFLLAYKALYLSQKEVYKYGIAEACHALGTIHLVNFSPRDSTKFYLNKALRLYKQLDDNEGLGKTYYAFAYFYSFNGNLKESEQQLQSALNYFKKANKNIGLYNTYNSLAYISKQYKEYTKAFDYQKKSIDVANELDDISLIADAQNNLGSLFKDQGLFKHAINSYFKSLELSQSINDSNGMAIAYGSIGNLYYFQKDYKNSLKYLFMKLPVSVSTNSYWEISKTYNSIALDYNQLDKPDTAIYYLNKSLALNKRMSYPPGIADVYHKLAQTYLIMNKVDSAEYFIQKAIKLGEKYNTSGNIAEYYLISGKIRQQLGNDQQALNDIQKGYKIAKSLNIPMVLKDASLLLSNIYAHYNTFGKAYLYLNEHIRLKDSLTNAEHLKNITRLELGYEFDEKERQLTFEKEQNKLLYQSDLKQQRFNFLIIIGLILFITILGVLLLRQKSLKIKYKSIDLEQRLLRVQMNPHFIFNSLCSIQDYILSNNNSEANKYLTRFSSLMRSTLENSRSDFIPVEKEIKELTNYLEIQKHRFEADFDYSIKIDEKIDAEIYNIPPMLTQPFIENSIEHGFLPKPGKGNLEIRYTLMDNKIRCEITDDGAGRNNHDESSFTKRKYTNTSLASLITIERLQLIWKKNKKMMKFEIVDLMKDGQPNGTKVIFNIPYKIHLN